MGEFYDLIRYQVVPPVFLVCFTFITQVLVVVGNPELTFSFWSLLSFGSPFAWKVVLSFYLWALLSMKVPGSKIFKGPPTPHGYVPVYAANGTQYYLVSLAAFFGIISFVWPNLCLWIYHDFAAIVQVLNLTSLLLCVYLMIKGKYFPETNDPSQVWDKPLPYLFYRGVELHPRILNADIKQWTNCRVGMMGWALLVIVFCVADLQTNGFNAGPIVHATLINIYLLKFFYWETGYFNTLDITLDRAGYYLCWGCLCWVQAFFTHTAFFMVGHPSKVTSYEALAIFIYGLVCIIVEYAIDRQKEVFRTTDGKCHIWGRPAKYLEVQYKTHEGKLKKSKLMLSGFWGIARHLNYFFELNIALSWCLPASRYGIIPYAYFIFLVVLLVHRTYRDEEKCNQKYGKGYKEYCEHVPYKLIPYVF